ncbi:hypothetical protein [Sebaldella sp. S0638]|uniref:hypothetical protein n=1 Tax=Sebaldella sp. S0638 TaxID=2957809 RepID=UPI00209E8314|nr:hypothetical protein [Sebaldella sp. S0638]MCP1225742.1 hypothetical protein [Sebaldella sp. S0638]
MKKIILFLISMALVFSITGCKAKKAVTAEEFKSKMTQKGYQIVDISEKYAGKGAKAVLIAMKDGYQIEFYVTENKDYAVGSYNLNKEKIEKTKGNSMVETQKSIGNVSKYTLKSNSSYKVVSRVGETFIYLNVPGSKTEEVKEILNKLGY